MAGIRRSQVCQAVVFCSVDVVTNVNMSISVGGEIVDCIRYGAHLRPEQIALHDVAVILSLVGEKSWHLANGFGMKVRTLVASQV